ncbi:FUSC family protein [Actinospica robiniae]|uniref:FUSC family protein n=1 Tax=Actinospica robiniae TaxID=304901 RepID=UPI0005503021|nr:FUSC family protein [Actinospica robiniae]
MFRLSPAGLNWPRAVFFLDVGLIPLIVMWAVGHEQYLLSALFGLLFTALVDPGGSYRHRAVHIGGFALLGAGLTAWAFGMGAEAWGWFVLAAFAVTLAAGLAVVFGVHRFVAALLLNVWFIVALALSSELHHTRIPDYVWAQTLAWVGGAALWLVMALLWWLVRGRPELPAPIAELPGDTERRALTKPVVLFAAIRALAIAGSTALAFGLGLSHGYWMPIATLIAMKPSLGQATTFAVQRIAGALIGAAAAMLLLLIPASENGLRLFVIDRGLEVVALVLFVHAAATRFWNYAIYCAFIAAGVLTLLDLTQPSNYGAEGDRVLWTLSGVGIGVLVLLLAELLGKRTTRHASTSSSRHTA